MTFHSVGNVIIPTDFHSIIFQRGGGSTTIDLIHEQWEFHGISWMNMVIESLCWPMFLW
jgi:hypothetical protein